MKESPPASIVQEGELQGKRSGRIFFRWVAPPAARARIIFIHGISEHSGRYIETMQALAARGFAIWVPDHRGHGRSARVPGDLEGMDLVQDDLERLRERTALACPGTPLFVIGHSMGGLIALRYALDHQPEIAGLVLSGAVVMIPPGMKVSPLLIRLSALLARVLPLLPVQKFSWGSAARDPAVLEEKRNDPYYYKGRIRARTGFELLQGFRSVPGRLPELRLPLLIMHGGEDRTVPVECSHIIHRQASSADKTLRIFPGVYHELFHEPEKEEVLALVGEWVEKRLR